MDMAPLIVTGSALATAGLCTAAWGMFSPHSRLFGPVIDRGDGDHIGVALTFDDGPDPERTPAILDALAAHDVRAAFFVVGVHARKHTSLLQRMHAAGHIVGNHTWDHPHFGTMRHKVFWRRQIGDCSDMIAQAIGVRPRFFRPPMGFRNWHTSAVLRERGDVCITWTRRAFDGIRSTAAARIVERLSVPARTGDVLLLHDGIDPRRRSSAGGGTPPEAIGPLIAACRDRNLPPTRLDELTGEAAYHTD